MKSVLLRSSIKDTVHKTCITDKKKEDTKAAFSLVIWTSG